MKNIAIIGMKNCGKSTLSRLIAEKFNLKLIVENTFIEDEHFARKAERLTFREIFKKYGEEYFRSLETECLKRIFEQNPENTLIDLGGGAVLRPENREIIKANSTVVLLQLDKKISYDRLIKNGIPAMFKNPEDPQGSFDLLWTDRQPIYSGASDYTIEYGAETPEEVLQKFVNLKLV